MQVSPLFVHAIFGKSLEREVQNGTYRKYARFCKVYKALLQGRQQHLCIMLYLINSQFATDYNYNGYKFIKPKVL